MSPRMPSSTCLTPGCPHGALDGHRRCRACLQAARALKGKLEDRPNAGERGYDALWRKVRRMKLARDPLCESCRKRRRTVAAQLVDHIVPIRAGGARLDLANLQSMCRRCHARKTEQDKELYPEAYSQA